MIRSVKIGSLKKFHGNYLLEYHLEQKIDKISHVHMLDMELPWINFLEFYVISW